MNVLSTCTFTMKGGGGVGIVNVRCRPECTVHVRISRCPIIPATTCPLTILLPTAASSMRIRLGASGPVHARREIVTCIDAGRLLYGECHCVYDASFAIQPSG